jgi:hypothetical protein
MSVATNSPAPGVHFPRLVQGGVGAKVVAACWDEALVSGALDARLDQLKID